MIASATQVRIWRGFACLFCHLHSQLVAILCYLLNRYIKLIILYKYIQFHFTFYPMLVVTICHLDYGCTFSSIPIWSLKLKTCYLSLVSLFKVICLKWLLIALSGMTHNAAIMMKTMKCSIYADMEGNFIKRHDTEEPGPCSWLIRYDMILSKHRLN